MGPNWSRKHILKEELMAIPATDIKTETGHTGDEKFFLCP